MARVPLGSVTPDRGVHWRRGRSQAGVHAVVAVVFAAGEPVRCDEPPPQTGELPQPGTGGGTQLPMTPIPTINDQTSVEVVVPASGSSFTATQKLNIFECADADGLTDNLPASGNACDGLTLNVTTESTGAAVDATDDEIVQLPSTTLFESANGSPVCSATSACVRYIGQNVSDFSAPFVFSQPFNVGAGLGTPTPESPAVIALPVWGPSSWAAPCSSTTTVGAAPPRRRSPDGSPALGAGSAGVRVPSRRVDVFSCQLSCLTMAEVPFVSLYRRFRPGRFDELRGQDHVVRALQSAVRDDRVSHAYLFSGPRGTGKTSSARILAKALNCLNPVDGEPCGECSSCMEITRGTSLDVLELDAASNNGVDAMRELVSHAALGTPGRWKVYIVDEVHMLSGAAANALLKTLEEPPSHVVFVLATTDPQKVPATIRSRTQHLEFRLLSADTLQTLLESVRESAGIDIDDGSLRTVVRRGRGSARDALSALDQVVASGAVASIRPELSSVVSALAESEVSGVLTTLSALLAEGWGPQQLATELVDDLRQVFLAALAPDLCNAAGAERSALADLAHAMGLPRVVRSMELLGHAMIDMRDAPDSQVVLEIALVRATRPDLDQGTAGLAERVGILERAIAVGGPVSRQPESVEEPKAPVTPETPTATVPEEPNVTQRPSVGAVLRSKSAATPAAPVAPSAPIAGTVPPPAPQDVPTIASAPQQGGGTPVISLDRESFTQAWGDGVLHGLSARAKALYSAGRFVAVDDDNVQFALPNEAHRAKCLDLVPVVEAALSERFETKIRLVLVVEGGDQGSRAPNPPVSKQETRSGQAEDEFDYDAPADFDDAQPASAVDRLLQAFPGAEEIVE